MASGSSPRGRGTPVFGDKPCSVRRFIPAWAGNALAARSIPAKLPVHPRVGGERRSCSGSDRLIGGSSPRGRGTHGLRPDECGAGRFIPAWAGNARQALRPRPARAVHPRVGGDRAWSISRWSRWPGSSPRGRGTPGRRRGVRRRRRFIPAWAGNAPDFRAGGEGYAVHPRVGGERDACPAEAVAAGGSSPRGRGTPGRRGAGP